MTGVLRTAAGRGARMASVCTGAFVLAAAGLLEGRRATTHREDAAALARRYPAIDVDPTCCMRTTGRLLTSAGLAAGLDMCLLAEASGGPGGAIHVGDIRVGP